MPCFINFKGLSGGNLIIYPSHKHSDAFKAEENIIVGNVCLYGATSGKVKKYSNILSFIFNLFYLFNHFTFYHLMLFAKDRFFKISFYSRLSFVVLQQRDFA